MKQIVKLTESDLNRIVKKVLNEQEVEVANYMFSSNLQQMKRQIEMMMEMDKEVVNEIIINGHDWADDHVSEAKNNLDQVFDFMMNEIHGDDIRTMDVDIEVMEEGKKKTGSKLCARGKSAAKAKFDVYPSAYANGYAVQVCKGRMPGLDGKKRCSPPYC